MSNTSSQVEIFERIKKASVMEADQVLFGNISEMIKYRKKIAIEILNCKDEEIMKNLNNIYDRADWHLRQLIGL